MVEGNAVGLFLKLLFLFCGIACSFNVTQTPDEYTLELPNPLEKKHVIIILPAFIWPTDRLVGLLTARGECVCPAGCFHYSRGSGQTSIISGVDVPSGFFFFKVWDLWNTPRWCQIQIIQYFLGFEL